MRVEFRYEDELELADGMSDERPEETVARLIAERYGLEVVSLCCDGEGVDGGWSTWQVGLGKFVVGGATIADEVFFTCSKRR